MQKGCSTVSVDTRVSTRRFKVIDRYIGCSATLLDHLCTSFSLFLANAGTIRLSSWDQSTLLSSFTPSIPLFTPPTLQHGGCRSTKQPGKSHENIRRTEIKVNDVHTYLTSIHWPTFDTRHEDRRQKAAEELRETVSQCSYSIGSPSISWLLLLVRWQLQLESYPTRVLHDLPMISTNVLLNWLMAATIMKSWELLLLLVTIQKGSVIMSLTLLYLDRSIDWFGTWWQRQPISQLSSYYASLQWCSSHDSCSTCIGSSRS